MGTLADICRLRNWFDLCRMKLAEAKKDGSEWISLRVELLLFLAEADRCFRSALDKPLPEEGDIFLEQRGGALRDDQVFHRLSLRQHIPGVPFRYCAIFWHGGP